MQDPFDLPFPVEAIRAQLLTIITSALEEYGQHSEDCQKEMEAWKQTCHRLVLRRLEGQLQKHRPRHGILEADVCSKRRSVLRNQHLRVENLLNNLAERIACSVGCSTSTSQLLMRLHATCVAAACIKL